MLKIDFRSIVQMVYDVIVRSDWTSLHRNRRTDW